MKSFDIQVNNARSLMDEGQYQAAFELIVDQDVQSLPDLLAKIECLIDIGFILRDEKILRYGLYLLETHGSEVLEVSELAPSYFINLAHQYANMVTLSSFENEYYGFFMRAEQVKARLYYEKALTYSNISRNLAFEAYKGLGQMFQSSGRGLDALEAYQQALKIVPDSQEVLHEKIRLMREYSLDSLPNKTEFLQEAWSLMERSQSAELDDDNQESLILKKRLLETGLSRDLLETDGEYPFRSIKGESKEEEYVIRFCHKNRLYLNLCSFCLKCDFSLGDTMELSSSSLTIRQGQKKRFVRLNHLYHRINDKFVSGRYIMLDAINPERRKDYVEKSLWKENKKSHDFLKLYQLESSFKAAWSLWSMVAEFIVLFWDLEDIEYKKDSFSTLFYKSRSIKEEWLKCKSPSLHAVFDLYIDCTSGKDKSLLKTFQLIDVNSEELNELGPEHIQEQCILLYRRMNTIIQYLGIMHERNEFSVKKWDFPRPLYNFVKIN